jgi:hypothetical protein
MSEPNTVPEQGHADFAIKDCALIAIATGIKVLTLRELRDHLTSVDTDSIYFHFWGGLLQPRFEEREFNNDFAAWVKHGLHDSMLAEQLAVLDPTDFHTLEELRQEMIEIIEIHLDQSEHHDWLRATHQFEFIRSQIVVFDTHHVVAQPEEMARLLPRFSVSSLFYHFIDARRRQPEGIDDFSQWFAGFNERYAELNRELATVDHYFGTLTELRANLTTIFERYLLPQGA